MKFLFAALISSFCISAFAQNLAQDLATKDCVIDMKKSVRLYKEDIIKEVGDINFMNMFMTDDIKLKKGKQYGILDTSEGTIGISYERNIILSCFTDGEKCLKDLSGIQTSDVLKLSNGIFRIKCE